MIRNRMHVLVLIWGLGVSLTWGICRGLSAQSSRRDAREAELDRLQDLVLERTQDFVKIAEDAKINPQIYHDCGRMPLSPGTSPCWQRFPLANPVGNSSARPYTLRASYSGPHGEPNDRWEDYLLVSLTACEDEERVGEFENSCRSRIVAYRLGGVGFSEEGRPAYFVVTDEDANAVSTEEASLRIDVGDGIVEAKLGRQRQTLTGAQLLDVLRRAAKAGEIRRRNREFEEDAEKRRQASSKELEEVRRGFAGILRFSN